MDRRLYLITWLLVLKCYITEGAVKIKMANSSNKPLSGDLDSASRRSFHYQTSEEVCSIIAANAGRLITQKLLALNYIEPVWIQETFLEGNVRIDAENLVSMLAVSASEHLNANCPERLIVETSLLNSRTILGQSAGQIVYIVPQSQWNQIVKNFQLEANFLLVPILPSLKIEQNMVTQEPKDHQSVILGSIIGCHLAKVLSSISVMTQHQGVDAELVSTLVSQILTKISWEVDYSTLNLATKTIYFWLINNFSLVRIATMNLVIKTTLENFGLSEYFPGDSKLLTNNAEIDVTFIKIFFPNYHGGKGSLIDYIMPFVDVEAISRDLSKILPKTEKLRIKVPEELKRLTLEPIKASKNNAILRATLSVILGLEFVRISPKLGIISAEKYDDLIPIEIPDILMKIAESLKKLELPFEESILGATKVVLISLKQTLNLDLLLKHYKLLKFFPKREKIETELTLVLEQFLPYKLWVKGVFVDEKKAVENRVKNLINCENVEDMLEELFDEKNSTKIKNFSDKHFTWDPPEILNFLYQPINYLKSSQTILESVKRLVNCPNHYMCQNSPVFYACSTEDPWCYFPDGIQCPGNINCPIIYKKLSCPGDPNCPIYIPNCPGDYSCSNIPFKCPGHPSCPVLLKCPGELCPKKFKIRPQILIPCPQHDFCSNLKQVDVIKCYSDEKCAYEEEAEIIGAIRGVGETIADAIVKKNSSIRINVSSSSNVLIDKENITAKSEANSSKYDESRNVVTAVADGPKYAETNATTT